MTRARPRRRRTPPPGPDVSKRYESVLGNFIRAEVNAALKVEIRPGAVHAVASDGRMEGDDVAELAHAREVTRTGSMGGMWN